MGISVFSGGQPLIIRTRGERKPFIIIFRFPFEDPVAFFCCKLGKGKEKRENKKKTKRKFIKKINKKNRIENLEHIGIVIISFLDF